MWDCIKSRKIIILNSFNRRLYYLLNNYYYIFIDYFYNYIVI